MLPCHARGANGVPRDIKSWRWKQLTASSVEIPKNSSDDINFRVTEYVHIGYIARTDI